MKSRRDTRLFQGCLAVLALSSVPAWAAGDVAVTGKLSTLGPGLELTLPIKDSFNGRFGFNTYNYRFSAMESGIDYGAKLRLQSVSLLGDWFPVIGSGFRVSPGLLYNNNKLKMTAKPAGTYTIGTITYAAAQIGSVDADVTFDKVAPYIGIGWGNAVAKANTWSFAADLGVLYQNSPKVKLAVTCGPALLGVPNGCTNLNNDAANEQADLQNAIGSFKWYPVISIGASYKF